MNPAVCKPFLLDSERDVVPTLRDLIWAAGFFDGEGYAGVVRRKSRGKVAQWQFSAQSTISQSDHPTLLWFKERWGGHVTGQQLRASPRILFGKVGSASLFTTSLFWTVSHKPLTRFLAEIRPYLKLKRRQVDNVLAFCKVQGTQGGYYYGLPADVYAQQERFYFKHKEIMAEAQAGRGRIGKGRLNVSKKAG